MLSCTKQTRAQCASWAAGHGYTKGLAPQQHMCMTPSTGWPPHATQKVCMLLTTHVGAPLTVPSAPPGHCPSSAHSTSETHVPHPTAWWWASPLYLSGLGVMRNHGRRHAASGEGDSKHSPTPAAHRHTVHHLESRCQPRAARTGVMVVPTTSRGHTGHVYVQAPAGCHALWCPPPTHSHRCV